MLTEQTIDLSDQITPIQIGVLSDTHGEISHGVLETLASCGIILHAGDVCGQKVLNQLGEIAATVIAVGGNNDGRFTYSQDNLPDLVHIKLPGGKISVLHGHQFGMEQPCHVAMRDEFSDSKTVIYGHSHKQLHDSDAKPWLLNPGAAGHTRTNGGSSCAVISIEDHNWSVALHKG